MGKSKETRTSLNPQPMQKMASALSFTLHQLADAPHSHVLRRGTLHFTKKAREIQTPACLTYTVRGSVPHLLQISLEQL
ncbi:hypothetical protein BDF14DRAFT_1863688 [Spinellus fusiger]|nr:hypothetical protein BDF14DRAFT_1863688 [Spinellus fusiger]